MPPTGLGARTDELEQRSAAAINGTLIGVVSVRNVSPPNDAKRWHEGWVVSAGMSVEAIWQTLVRLSSE